MLMSLCKICGDIDGEQNSLMMGIWDGEGGNIYEGMDQDIVMSPTLPRLVDIPTINPNKLVQKLILINSYLDN